MNVEKELKYDIMQMSIKTFENNTISFAIKNLRRILNEKSYIKCCYMYYYVFYFDGMYNFK